ncbi:hypothetical protein KHA80_11445 [Anaerobacillus sp. HL2]|nr:hypothetical protein KHA80_11445 [Anaerobacillus sp. HL2]
MVSVEIKKSLQAALKYVVLGGTASATILYGMSFLYGLTGTTSLVDISWNNADALCSIST